MLRYNQHSTKNNTTRTRLQESIQLDRPIWCCLVQLCSLSVSGLVLCWFAKTSLSTCVQLLICHGKNSSREPISGSMGGVVDILYQEGWDITNGGLNFSWSPETVSTINYLLSSYTPSLFLGRVLCSSWCFMLVVGVKIIYVVVKII